MRKWPLIQTNTLIRKGKSLNVSWSELIFKDRSLKTLADGKSVTNRAGFSILQVLTGHLPLVTCTSRETYPRFNMAQSLQIGYYLDLRC